MMAIVYHKRRISRISAANLASFRFSRHITRES